LAALLFVWLWDLVDVLHVDEDLAVFWQYGAKCLCCCYRKQDSSHNWFSNLLAFKWGCHMHIDLLFPGQYNDIRSFLVQIEGPKLMQSGFADAIAKVGISKFVSDLFWVGMFYHLYNQVWIFLCILVSYLSRNGYFRAQMWNRGFL